MFGRNLRTRFSSLLPQEVKQVSSNAKNCEVRKRVVNLQKKQVSLSKPNKCVDYQLNENVLVKNYKCVNKPTFIKGKIIKKIGKKMYLVEIPELQVTWRRHSNQMKKYAFHSVESKLPVWNSVSEVENLCTNDVNIDNVSVNSDNVHSSKVNNYSDRPRRHVKPVERLAYN